MYCFFCLTNFKQPHQYQSETMWEVAGCSITRKYQASSHEILMPTGLSLHHVSDISIKHSKISIVSSCQKPNLNHFPSVARSLPVCQAVTSQSNPQMRINQGLEIRYENVLSPLRMLLHTTLPLLYLYTLQYFLVFLDLCHTHRPNPSLVILQQKSQSTHMQMRWWLRCYLEAIMVPVS